MLNIFTQFIIAMIATYAFCIPFNAPKNQYLYCAITGAIAWAIYEIVILFLLPGDKVLACLLASLLLTIVSRFFAVRHKFPVTVFLIPGIFPLVPGAGIYYTAYHLIMSNTELCRTYAQETFMIAGAIVIGLVFGFAIPQNIFSFFKKRSTQ